MRHSFSRTLPIAVLLACAITASQAQGQVAKDHAGLSRRDHEAQKVLKLVVAKEPLPGRCRYGVDWDRYKLDADEMRLAYVAAKFTVPPAIGDFRTIIDPDHHVDATVFCTNAELKSYTDERVAAFAAGSEQHMQIDRTLFSYPAFNQWGTEAFVVVTYLALDGRSRVDGRIGRLPTGRGVEARVYRKVGGSWRFVRSKLLAIS